MKKREVEKEKYCEREINRQRDRERDRKQREEKGGSLHCVKY